MAKVWDKLAGQLLHPEHPGCHNQVHILFNHRLVLSILLILFESGWILYIWGFRAWSFLPQTASAVLLCMCALGVRQPLSEMAREWDKLAGQLLHPERPGCHNQVQLTVLVLVPFTYTTSDSCFP
jgi:hypothetical protein